MIVNMIGIVDDGSARAPHVPISAAKTIKISLSQDLLVRLSVVYPSGVPVNMVDQGYDLRMTVRKNFAAPAQYTAAAIAAAKAAGCSCAGSGKNCSSRGCSARRYGRGSSSAVVMPAPDILVIGTLVPDEGINRVDFLMDRSMTYRLMPGRYGYDIRAEVGAFNDILVPLSPFIIAPTVGLPTV